MIGVPIYFHNIVFFPGQLFSAGVSLTQSDLTMDGENSFPVDTGDFWAVCRGGNDTAVACQEFVQRLMCRLECDGGTLVDKFILGCAEVRVLSHFPMHIS